MTGPRRAGCGPRLTQPSLVTQPLVTQPSLLMQLRGLCLLLTLVLMILAAARTAAATEKSAAEPQGFWTGPVNSPVPHTIAGGKVIHARRLAAMLKRSHPVLIDVSNAPRRPENLAPQSAWLPLPHQAIPGAVWIPGAGLGEPDARIVDYYRKRLEELTAGNPSQPLVVYCHQRCWLSWNGAKRAIGYGYRQVYWFPEGIEGWRAARLPTVVVDPQPVP